MNKAPLGGLAEGIRSWCHSWRIFVMELGSFPFLLSYVAHYFRKESPIACGHPLPKDFPMGRLRVLLFIGTITGKLHTQFRYNFIWHMDYLLREIPTTSYYSSYLKIPTITANTANDTTIIQNDSL